MSLTRRRFIWKSGVGLVGSALTTGFYAWRIEPHWVEIVERPLPVAQLSAALTGKRLVQISDLHVGPRVDDDYLMASLDRVRDLRPDILVVTGDLVSYWGAGTFTQLDRVLSRLPRGARATLAILGNHDYGRGWSQADVADKVTARLTGLGVEVLRNGRTSVDGLEIIGLDDFWGPRFFPQRALAGLDRPSRPWCFATIPTPWTFPSGAVSKDRILAGHTHGGECKPPFLPPPILPNEEQALHLWRIRPGRRPPPLHQSRPWTS